MFSSVAKRKSRILVHRSILHHLNKGNRLKEGIVFKYLHVSIYLSTYDWVTNKSVCVSQIDCWEQYQNQQVIFLVTYSEAAVKVKELERGLRPDSVTT